MRRAFLIYLTIMLLTNCPTQLCVAVESPDGLVGHWKLQGDCRDYSGQGNHAVNRGVNLDGGVFDGVGDYLEVPQSESLRLGTRDFTICIASLLRRNSTTRWAM